MHPITKKRLIGAAKIIIVVAVFFWIGWELSKSWDTLRRQTWTPDYIWLGLAGAFYIIGYVPAALFWRYSMQAFGQRPGLYEALRAYYIGHLGKYIPGKAVVVVLRSGLLNSERTRPGIAAAAVFLETLTMMAVGALLSALIVIVWFRDMPQSQYLVLLAAGLTLVAGGPIYPPFFRWTAKRLGLGRSDPEIDTKLAGLNVQTLGIGLGLMTITWIFLGLSLWATILGVGIDPGLLSEHLPRFVLAAALSVVLGFVLMIPGGIGVREAAMASVLTVYFVNLAMSNNPEMSFADAEALALGQGIVIAAVQRVISILAELLASAVLVLKKDKAAGAAKRDMS